MKKFGIDLGGTKIEIIVLDENNEEIHRKRIPTEQDKGYEHILDNIEKLYRETLEVTFSPEHSLGIGTPGSLSTKTGLLNYSNTTCLNGNPVKKDLEVRLKRPIVFENDASCFALAEAQLGAGKGKELCYGVIMGTGCGGKIVLNGKIRNGPHRGEWGHMIIDPSGPEHFRGFNGVVENYISGGGLESLYEQQYGEKQLLKNITDGYRKEEEPYKTFFLNFIEKFGTAYANLINVLDPDVIVLGGGVSKINELYTIGVQEVQKHFTDPLVEDIIVQHKLGDSAGVLGAALVGSTRS